MTSSMPVQVRIRLRFAFEVSLEFELMSPSRMAVLLQTDLWGNMTMLYH